MKHDATTLLADLGGTNVRFALCDPSAASPLIGDSIRRHKVASFASLADAASAYLAEIGAAPRTGVFAVAGRIDGDQVRITNHPWTIGIDETRRRLHLQWLEVRNDFAAMSMALVLLAPRDLHAIGTLAPPDARAEADATFAVLGPGTGLGVGALLRRDGHYHALETEGGHIAFAPVGDEEIEILRVLRTLHPRVSIERVVSGIGLSNLHRALCRIAGVVDDPLSPETITERASASADPMCVRTVELAAALLGTIAGNFVLAYGAWNGVYLAGGMTQKLRPWLDDGRFRMRFEDKGRFADALRRVPTAAITHSDAGLLGAAAIAMLANTALLGQGRRSAFTYGATS
jgi:glucokinase